MKTSKINIRPFKPWLKNEEKEGREPFATLKFGNVEIELDYTIIRNLGIDTNNCLVSSVSHRAFEEIVKEMECSMSGELPRYHRDTEEFKRLPMTHNPLYDFTSNQSEKDCG